MGKHAQGPGTGEGIGGARRQAAFVYHDALSRHVLSADHPLKAIRLRYTYELLEAYKAFDSDNSSLVEPRPATEEEVRNFHQEEYVEAVKSFSRGERELDTARFNMSSTGDNPIYDGMYDAAALSAGASLVAGEIVGDMRGDVAFNISGGLHHAASGYASGFCVFNDPVIAINYLLGKGFRVAYVDIDAHHGDGVQNAFYDNDMVITISLHESGKFLFPGTGHVHETGAGAGNGFSVNLPLYPYTGDDTYLWAFREVVPPLVKAFKPDVLFTQLGIDSYCNDHLAHLLLTTRGFSETVREFGRWGLPWVATGGGGYDLGAVARCWTLAYGIMAGRDWPDEIPPDYQEKYEIKQLRDTQVSPVVPENMSREARNFAEETVKAVKQLIFPVHGLSQF